MTVRRSERVEDKIKRRRYWFKKAIVLHEVETEAHGKKIIK